MGDLGIETHSFETSKNQLKKFSEQTTADLDLKKVDTSKGVGEWFGEWLKGGGIGTDHKVTGAELNELTKQIQKHLSHINDMHYKLIQEFGQVYNALEALDKDYIQAILIAVKSAQKANEEVKVAQGDIEKTIALQKKTIKVLEQFKEKIDKYKHLSDVDKMWQAVQTQQYAITTLEKYVKEITVSVSTHSKSLDSLIETRDMLNAIEHLADIDSMWSKVTESDSKLTILAENVKNLITKLNEQSEQLKSYNEFKKRLVSQEHIFDIDVIWNGLSEMKEKTETVITQMQQLSTTMEQQVKVIDELVIEKQKLDSLSHLYDVDVMYDDSQALKKDIDILKDTISRQQSVITNLQDSLLDECKKSEEMERELSRKIKMAYLLAGSSVGLVVIEFILIMMRLI